MTTRWKGKGRLRLAMHQYARDYLQVDRLPPDVARLVDDWVDAIRKPSYGPFDAPPDYGRALAVHLRPFRKPVNLA